MRTIATATAIAATLAGCGADPYTQQSETPPQPPAGEAPSRPIEQPTYEPDAGHTTPEAAGRTAAELAGNWTTETIRDRYTQLANRTTGQARAEAERVAAQATTDPDLADAKSISIVHAVTATGTGDRRRLIIVTHETLTGPDLRSARWRVTLAEATRTPRGWVLADWAPQP